MSGEAGAEVRFWDTSAVVPLVVMEPATNRVKALAEDGSEVVIWWSTPVELASAIHREERERNLPEEVVEAARIRADGLVGAWLEIAPTDRIRSRAKRMLAVHSLRGADALQLAAALAWSDGGEAEMVCLDGQLGRAASREGFTVLDGSNPGR